MTQQGQSKLAGRHVLVLGAGYVGGAVLEHLSGSGARLTALTRNLETAALLSDRGVKVVCADLATDEWHAQLSEGADFVLNCVGSGGGGVEAYRHSYLGGMASLLRWSALAPVGHVVYTSSVSVYTAGGGAVVDESAELASDGGPSSVLVEAERLFLGGKPGPRRRHVLRLAGIYGPGRHRFLDQMISGERVAGQGERHLNLIHRDDIVSAVLATWGATEALADQVFNVADDGQATRAEIAAWLARRLGKPMPAFTGEAAGGRARNTPDRIISNSLVKSALGWSPSFPSFREGYSTLLAET